MIGIVYDKNTYKIVEIINNVKYANQNEVVGESSSIVGIAENYNYLLVESTNYQIGDIIDIKGEKLKDIKIKKIKEIDAACNADILNGFISSALGEPHEYKFDYEAQINFLGIKEKANNDINFIGQNWSTKDAGVIFHTKEQFIQLYNDALQAKLNKQMRYWDIKDQILNATSEDEINSIVW